MLMFYLNLSSLFVFYFIILFIFFISSCSLCHQMLNCCIDRKKTRESAAATDSPRSVASTSPSQDELNQSAAKELLNRSLSLSSSDDEFYECMDDDEEEGGNGDKTATPRRSPRPPKQSDSKEGDVKKSGSKESSSAASLESQEGDDKTPDMKASTTSLSDKRQKRISRGESAMDTSSYMDTFTHQAEGRLKEFGEMKLLNVPEESLYVPVTQEPALMTEDMLEEHAVVLEK